MQLKGNVVLDEISIITEFGQHLLCLQQIAISASSQNYILILTTKINNKKSINIKWLCNK